MRYILAATVALAGMTSLVALGQTAPPSGLRRPGGAYPRRRRVAAALR